MTGAYRKSFKMESLGHECQKLWFVCNVIFFSTCYPFSLFFFSATVLLFYLGGVLLVYSVWFWWVCQSCGPTNSTIGMDTGVRRAGQNVYIISPVTVMGKASLLFSTWSTKVQSDFLFQHFHKCWEKRGFFSSLALASCWGDAGLVVLVVISVLTWRDPLGEWS